MAQLNLYWSIYHLLLSRCIRCRPLPISGPDKSLHRIQLGLSRAATTQCTGKTAATPAQLISVAALISQKKKYYSKPKPERDVGEAWASALGSTAYLDPLANKFKMVPASVPALTHPLLLSLVGPVAKGLSRPARLGLRN